MKLAVPVALAGLTACGSSSGPATTPVEPAPKKVNRVVVEDESAQNETPEEGVTFVRTKGLITPETIEAGLAPHQVAMAECYTQKVGKRRWLGGHVVLQWNLRGDGTLTSVKLTESNLGSWAVEQCLLDIAWGASFGKPSGGDVDFTVPLDFSAKGASLPWDEDQALRAVGGQLAMLDDCEDFEYEPKPVKKTKKSKKAPKAKPKKDDKAEPSARPARPEKPPSNVTMTMYVGPGGKLQSLGFASATTEVGQKWAACAEAVAQSWRLPDPRGQIVKLALRYKAAD